LAHGGPRFSCSHQQNTRLCSKGEFGERGELSWFFQP
jgi:hypothetical protein